MPNHLFVYGTLRPSSLHPMARRLAELARPVSAARIAGRLYHLGRYPGLKGPRSAEDWVQGDVYDLGENAEATLRELDVYENEDAVPPTVLYEREPTTVLLADGGTMTAWIYWYRGEIREENFIASGSWAH